MKNMGNMLKQAKKLQSQMTKIQDEMGGKTVTASAGGGMVEAVVNGKQQLLSLKISPEAVEDLEMLQDMVVAAVNKAQEEAQEMMQSAMGEIMGGMNLPF